MPTAYLSTAYLAPVQYYCKLYQYPVIRMETNEHYIKQSYRNRCHVAAANGVMPLSIPIEKSETVKTYTKDIRLSDHGNWRHLHWNTLVSAYNMSAFFEYYADDFAPFYERKYNFLLDFNESFRSMICRLMDLDTDVIYTESYEKEVTNDYREAIRPKHSLHDPQFNPVPYYQVFQDKHGFQPNLSIVDLLFNMGPESLLILRDSILRS